MESTMLDRHVSTVSQNGIAKHWLWKRLQSAALPQDATESYTHNIYLGLPDIEWTLLLATQMTLQWSAALQTMMRVHIGRKISTLAEWYV